MEFLGFSDLQRSLWVTHQILCPHSEMTPSISAAFSLLFPGSRCTHDIVKEDSREQSRWNQDLETSNDQNPSSWGQLIQECKNVPICLSHQLPMSSLEEVAEKSFPPNGLLGCLCTVVSWWLQPTSSKTKVHVSKIPSQLTLIGISVGLSCESRPEWAEWGTLRGVWHQGDGSSEFATDILLSLSTTLVHANCISHSIVCWLGKLAEKPLFRALCHWTNPTLRNVDS